MIVVDVTWLGYFMTLVSMYYVVLFIFSMGAAARRDPEGGPRPPMAIIVPAHDEEAVIVGTLESLLGLDYDRFCVIVVNDGSTDGTADRARAFEDTGRVRVVDRPPEVAGRGKGAVLNEGYRVLGELLAQGDPLVAGFDPDEVVVGSWMPTATSSLARCITSHACSQIRESAECRWGHHRQRRGRPDAALPGSRICRLQPTRAGGAGSHRIRRSRRQRSVHEAGGAAVLGVRPGRTA